MKERIKELAVESGMNLMSRRSDGLYVVSEDAFEKFASLLVKDTLDLIEKESEKVSEKWTCKDGVHIWWKIVEHFGVER